MVQSKLSKKLNIIAIVQSIMSGDYCDFIWRHWEICQQAQKILGFKYKQCCFEQCDYKFVMSHSYMSFSRSYIISTLRLYIVQSNNPSTLDKESNHWSASLLL